MDRAAGPRGFSLAELLWREKQGWYDSSHLLRLICFARLGGFGLYSGPAPVFLGPTCASDPTLTLPQALDFR